MSEQTAMHQSQFKINKSVAATTAHKSYQSKRSQQKI
jgi:hypothetical protein